MINLPQISRSTGSRGWNGRTIRVTIRRELPVTVLASVLGARGGQPLPADFAVHPRPEPRLHVTAAGCTVFAAAAGTLLLAPAVDEAAQRRGERRLHPATSNTQAREETVEKGDERGEFQIPNSFTSVVNRAGRERTTRSHRAYSRQKNEPISS